MPLLWRVRHQDDASHPKGLATLGDSDRRWSAVLRARLCLADVGPVVLSDHRRHVLKAGSTMPISRRDALVGTGISLAATTIAGCATYGKPPVAPAAKPAPAPQGPAAPVQAIARTADVPVGSGVIVDDVVITQPKQGDFKGFSAICTHAGCTVAEVVDGSINCP